mmetsp:Transcript_40821/g.68405  ORF Transcript_40821/g.68405 Transcript_40821/m.68405 type:complete len:540 (-) Transcript_40821:523-2142(-)
MRRYSTPVHCGSCEQMEHLHRETRIVHWVTGCRCRSLRVGNINDHCLGGQEQPCHRTCVLQAAADDLRGIHNSSHHEVVIGPNFSIVAHVRVVVFRGRLADILQHDVAILPSVARHQPQRIAQRALDDVSTNPLLVILQRLLDFVHFVRQLQQSAASTDDNALFHGSLRGIQRIFHTQFLLLQFCLSLCTDLDDGNTPRKASNALSKLLLLIVRSGIVQHPLDLSTAGLYLGLRTPVPDNGGRILRDLDTRRCAQHFSTNLSQVHSQFFFYHRAPCQNGNVLQILSLPLTEAWGFNGTYLQGTSESIHHKCGKGFLLNIFRHNDEREALLDGQFQDLDHVTSRSDLLVDQQQPRSVVGHCVALRISDKVRRHVATFKRHTFHDVKVVIDTPGLLEGDHALAAHLFHRSGDHVAHFHIPTRRNGGHICQLGVLYLLRHPLQLLHQCSHGLIHPPGELHRVGTSSHNLHPLGDEGRTQNCSGGGPIPRLVVRLLGRLADQLGPNSLHWVLQVDLSSDRDTVVDDLWRSEAGLQHHVPALGP